MGYRSEAELDALDGAGDDGTHAYASPRAKPTRIDIGNGRVWAKSGHFGWVEALSTFRQGAVCSWDVAEATWGARRLTPAEVARAERGLGPSLQSFGDAMQTATDRATIRERLDRYDREDAEQGEGPEPADDFATRVGNIADVLRGMGVETVTTVRTEGGARHAEIVATSQPDIIGTFASAATEHPADTTYFEPDVIAVPARTEGITLPVLTIEDPNTGERISLPAGQTITLTAVRTAEPGGTERGAWVPTSQVPACLTPEQAARYQDATSGALRRLAIEQATIAIDASLAYRLSTFQPAEDRPELAELTAADTAASLIAAVRGTYVSTGDDPIPNLESNAAWRASSTCGVSRYDGEYLTRILPHIRAALAGSS